MHITIDNCSLCHDTRVVRLQGKHYPCPECETESNATARRADELREQYAEQTQDHP